MGKVKITLVRSIIDASKNQKNNIQGLGLKKVNSSVTHEATPQILGMVRKVQHLVSTEHIA